MVTKQSQLVKPEPKIINVPQQTLLGDKSGGQRDFADILTQISDTIISPVLESYVADRGGDPRNLATYQGRVKRREIEKQEYEAELRRQQNQTDFDRRVQLAELQSQLAAEGREQQAQIDQQAEDNRRAYEQRRLNEQREFARTDFGEKLGLGIVGTFAEGLIKNYFDGQEKIGNLASDLTKNPIASEMFKDAVDRSTNAREEAIKLKEELARVGNQEEADKVIIPEHNIKNIWEDIRDQLESSVKGVKTGLNNGSLSGTPNALPMLNKILSGLGEVSFRNGLDPLFSIVGKVEELNSEVMKTPTVSDKYNASTVQLPTGDVMTETPNGFRVQKLPSQDPYAQANNADAETRRAQLNQQVREYNDSRNPLPSGSTGAYLRKTNDDTALSAGFARWLGSKNDDYVDTVRQGIIQRLRDSKVAAVAESANDPYTVSRMVDDELENLYLAEDMAEAERKFYGSDIKAKEYDEANPVDQRELEDQIRADIQNQKIDDERNRLLQEYGVDAVEDLGSNLTEFDNKMKAFADETPVSPEEVEDGINQHFENIAAIKNKNQQARREDIRVKRIDLNLRKYKNDPYLRSIVATNIGSGSVFLPRFDSDGRFILADEQPQLSAPTWDNRSSTSETQTKALLPEESANEATMTQLRSKKNAMDRRDLAMQQANGFEGLPEPVVPNQYRDYAVIFDRVDEMQARIEQGESNAQLDSLKDFSNYIARRSSTGSQVVDPRQLGAKEIASAIDIVLLRHAQSLGIEDPIKHVMDITSSSIKRGTSGKFWGFFTDEQKKRFLADGPQQLRFINYAIESPQGLEARSKLPVGANYIDINGIFGINSGKTNDAPKRKPQASSLLRSRRQQQEELARGIGDPRSPFARARNE